MRHRPSPPAAALLLVLSAAAVALVAAACGVLAYGLMSREEGGPVAWLLGACTGVGAVALARAAHSAGRHLRAQEQLLAGLGDCRVLDGAAPPVAVFADAVPRAFCAGLRRPQVYVSTGALERLDDAALAAVVAHERHHARRRDPLRLAAMRVARDGLLFLPVLAPLVRRCAHLAEVEADRAAVRGSGGDPAPLARALLLFEAEAAPAAALDPERVDVLLGRPRAWPLPLAPLAWALVALAALLALSLRGLETLVGHRVDVTAFGATVCLAGLTVTLVVVSAGALALRTPAWRRG